MSQTRRRFIMAGTTALATTRASWAQAVRTAHFIVPYPPGGVMDAIARQVTPALEKRLGEHMLVENVPGAAGSMGLQHLLNGSDLNQDIAIGSDSDTLLVPMFNAQVKYRPVDFRLIGLIGSGPMVLVASGKLPNRPIASLLESAREGTLDQLSFGNYGVDSNSHLIAQDFANRAQLNVAHIPYKGIAPVVQDLGGGHVDMAFLPLAGLSSLLTESRVRALAIAAASRHPTMASVATLEESLGWKNFRYSSWAGLVAQKSMSDAAATRYSDALRGALTDPSFRTVFEAGGGTLAAPLTLDEAQRFFDQAADGYRRLVASLRDRAGANPGR